MLRWCHVTRHYSYSNYGTKAPFFLWSLQPEPQAPSVAYAGKLMPRTVHSSSTNMITSNHGYALRKKEPLPTNQDSVHVSFLGSPGFPQNSLMTHHAEGTSRAADRELYLHPHMSITESRYVENAQPMLITNCQTAQVQSRGTRGQLGLTENSNKGSDERLETFIRTTSTTNTAFRQDFHITPQFSHEFKDVANFSTALGIIRKLFDDSVGFGRQLTAETLVSLYQDFGLELFHELDPRQRSELLRLFGTMSDGTSPKRFCSEYISRVEGNFMKGGYWKEAKEIAAGYRKSGHHMGVVDTYWAMRAYMEDAKGTGSTGSIRTASKYYSHMKYRDLNSRTFIPYFEALLFLPLSPDPIVILDALCDFLKRRRNPSKDLVDVLWKIILVHGINLPSKSKVTILDVFSHRLSQSSYLTAMAGSYPDKWSCPKDIHELGANLMAPFFPCYDVPEMSSSVRRWILRRCRAVTSSASSLDERFLNLVLFAIWRFPQISCTLNMSDTTTNVSAWRKVLGLAILDRLLWGGLIARPVGGEHEVRATVRSFWQSWKDDGNAYNPRELERLIVMTSFRISIKIQDEPLFKGCVQYLFDRQLWGIPRHDQIGLLQIEQLFLAYLDGALAFQEQSQDWKGVLAVVDSISVQREHFIGLALGRITAYDVHYGYHFYKFCSSHAVAVPSNSALLLAQSLASHEEWESVVPFLNEPSFSNSQLQQLLESVLHVFQAKRREYAHPQVAKAIGESMWKLHAKAKLPVRLKYPARFFISIMIASQQSRQGVALLEAMLRNNPSMFTSRFLARIARLLTQHRQHTLAVKVSGFGKQFLFKTSSICNLGHKVFRGLAKNRAVRLANRICRYWGPSTRNRILRKLMVKEENSPKYPVFPLRLISIHKDAPIHASTVISSIQLLVKARRFSAARKVIEKLHGRLSEKDLTTVGNIYLHGPMTHRKMRNRRLVEYILRTKSFLMKEYGFNPDRATVNIIVKAMLRWRTRLDTRKIKSLFDHLTRNGYPVTERWHTDYSVPFGTPLNQGIRLDMSSVRKNMSFKHHVRPLYKMFIKEFFLRGDRRAAHKVVGILKEEEMLALQRKERREQARRLGIEKKRKRAWAREARSASSET